MIECHQPAVVTRSIERRIEKVHRENITLLVLLSIAFFFGGLFTTFAILALVVMMK